MLTGRDPEDLPHKGLAIDVRAALRGRASDRMIGVLEKMLDPDPDRRASRIGPLVERTGERERAAPRQGRSDRQDAFAQRHARREARRAERRARRLARRRHGAPFPFSLLVTIVFLVAMLAVSAATQVVIPFVLTVLSLFVARRALGLAVDSVRDAGHRAVDAMDRARRGARAELDEAVDRLRVEHDVEPSRVRVDEAGGAELDAEDRDEDVDVARRARR